MRVLRRTGDDLKWSAKLVSEYDEDDKHHKDAMAALAKYILHMTGTRNYYLDCETLMSMYDVYTTYGTNVVPVREQEQRMLYDKLKEKA